MKKIKKVKTDKDGIFLIPNFKDVNDNEEVISEIGREKQLTEALASSHTKTEQLLYQQMFVETRNVMTKIGVFSTRYLMVQTGIHSYSRVRRAQIGLVNKMSIERQKNCGTGKSSAIVYMVYNPSEIIARRLKVGFNPYPGEEMDGVPDHSSGLIIEKLVQQQNLSHRQAQVALKCAEGLSNAEIGEKLLIRQETVKFHLRNIFIKFGIRRRTELIAYLFRRELVGLAAESSN